MKNQEAIYGGLVELYENEIDHWNYDNPEITKSYGLLLDLIKQVPHASILEVGCAEGIFTKMLTTLSNDVTAFDVSPIAVERAKSRVSGVKFSVSTLEDFPADRKYDVVVCSEVLCYILDKKQAANKLAILGHYLATSNFFADFPKFCLGSVKAEWALRRFPVVKRIVEYNIPKIQFTPKTLRKLV